MLDFNNPNKYVKNFLQSKFAISSWLERCEKDYTIAINQKKKKNFPIYCISKVCKYETEEPNAYIEKCEICDNRMEEHSLFFEKISSFLLSRGYMRFPEFYSICKWKTQRQIKNYLKNSVKDIKLTTEKVMDDSLPLREKIIELTKLKGVKVPVASMLLTIIFPKKYCVFDYRVWQSFLWLTKSINSSIFEDYNEYADFLRSLRKSNDLESYLFFHKVISNIAEMNKKTPRQIEQALYKFDKENGKT